MDEDVFNQKLKAYADLLLSLGVNLQQGEYCLIQALTVHRELALTCAEQAYKKGASYVHVIYLDELLDCIRLEHAEFLSLDYFSSSVINAYEEVLENNGVFLSFAGRERIGEYENIDPERSNKMLLARAENLAFFHDKVSTNALKWCVAASATAGTAQKIFPRLPVKQAVRTLWEEYFLICRINTSDPFKTWREHIDRLNSIKLKLNRLKISELSFKGPQIDLTIGISNQARWQGGESYCQNGQVFVPNIPTEEVFTVPDFRRVNGWVECSRPLVYRNIYIEKIRLEFTNGMLSDISGSRGIDTLKHYIFSRPENRLLGEVALVESTSPVFLSGYVFHNLLYDENAASHIAFGSAFSECFKGIEQLDAEQKNEAGFNVSKIHVDVMIGSPEVSVSARLSSGKTVPLIENGEFVIL
ncbi:MAG: aminopeptidase [Spirochaetales bacterium]|nr:aminopeptidase [Spirochaetales bacterium]